MRPIPTDNIRSSEEWLPVVGFELLYLVSRWGQVFSLISDKVLKPGAHTRGYVQLTLCKNGRYYNKLVHRLVMEAFVGPCPEGMQVNHKDGDKLNNCLSNLEYVTKSENEKHAHKTGLKNQAGSLNGYSFFIEKDIPIIRQRYSDGETQQFIADDYGVCRETIRAIVNRKNWKNVRWNLLLM